MRDKKEEPLWPLHIRRRAIRSRNDEIDPITAVEVVRFNIKSSGPGTARSIQIEDCRLAHVKPKRQVIYGPKIPVVTGLIWMALDSMRSNFERTSGFDYYN